MLLQTTSLEVTLIRHRNGIEKSMWRTHQYFIDFESRIDVELYMSNRCHLFHVDSPLITDEILTNFRRGISISNLWRIDEDVSIGFTLSTSTNMDNVFSELRNFKLSRYLSISDHSYEIINT